MKRQIIVFLIALVLGLSSSFALANIEARNLIEDNISLIMNRLSTNSEVIKQNPHRAAELVNEILLPHFDTYKMAKKALGKNWSKASKLQRKRFMKQYKLLLIRTYSKVLADNVDSNVEFLKIKKLKKANETLVRTEVKQDAGFPIPINYKMRLADGQWKVYDVIIDDISMAMNYRGSFSKQIRKGGMDELIANLVDRNKQL